MANTENILERVLQLISDQLNLKGKEISPNAGFREDLGANSLDIVELIMKMEDEFGIEIADEEVEKIKTIQDAVNYIKENVT